MGNFEARKKSSGVSIMAINPFDFVNSINTTKVDLISTSDDPELMEKEYNPFLTNKALSYFIDTITLANEMNSRYDIDHKYQYDFLRATVRKRKRITKWHKQKNDDDINAVIEYYGYSLNKAKNAIKILTKEQIEQIKINLTKGGVKK